MIRFGTGGWRAVIADEFTKANLRILAAGLCRLMEKEGHAERYVFGFEESYGYLSGTDVRDKDAVNAAVLVLENVTSTPTTLSGVTVAGHSVYISIYGGDNTDIARAIYNKLDAGCGTNGDTLVTYNPASDNAEDQPDALYSYYVKRPTATETAIKVTVEDAQATSLTDAIKQAVVDNFNGLTSYRRIKMGDTVYSSRFYADVIKAGVNKLVSVEIKYPAATGSYGDSATVPADEIPTISADDVTIVYA